MDLSERDAKIVQYYLEGFPASKVAAQFGLSIAQVRRILSDCEVKKPPTAKKWLSAEEKVIDPIHRKVGHRLYSYRFMKPNDVHQASTALGWSVKKLRGIEQGHSTISLVDLQAIAGYMNISLSDLLLNL